MRRVASAIFSRRVNGNWLQTWPGRSTQTFQFQVREVLLATRSELEKGLRIAEGILTRSMKRKPAWRASDALIAIAIFGIAATKKGLPWGQGEHGERVEQQRFKWTAKSHHP
jgi:hypothetical protein